MEMEIGIIWYDNNKERTLEDKIALAVEHYKAKYHQAPTVCYVNPNLLLANSKYKAGESRLLTDVYVLPQTTVAVDQFLIGYVAIPHQ